VGYGQQSGNAEDSIAQMQADLATELAQIWQRTKGTTLDRVQDLTTIVSTLETDQFDSDRQQQAIRTAHKLAGSLGTFGFDQGSRIAKELEVLFQGQTNRPNLRQKATSLIQDLQVLLQADPRSSPGKRRTRTLPIQDMTLVPSDICWCWNRIKSFVKICRRRPLPGNSR
jgi:HPt (histidine-containing phosphotransfer) domain-containing protein